MIFHGEQFGTFKDLRELGEYLQRVLNQLEAVTNEISELQLEELNRAPDKSVHGKMYFADGTNWNPGSGRGVYVYDSTGPTWRFLG